VQQQVVLELQVAVVFLLLMVMMVGQAVVVTQAVLEMVVIVCGDLPVVLVRQAELAVVLEF
jgi:hypothetical protein